MTNEADEVSAASRGSHGQAITMVIDAEIRALMHGAVSLRLHAAERARGQQELTDASEMSDLLAMANVLDAMRREREAKVMRWKSR
jgi:hypothetical protein